MNFKSTRMNFTSLKNQCFTKVELNSRGFLLNDSDPEYYLCFLHVVEMKPFRNEQVSELCMWNPHASRTYE